MKQRDILFLVISTFVLIVAWVGFSIYHNFISSTITKPVKEKIAPINPDFDTKIIDKLKERKSVEPIFQVKSRESTESALIENISTESASEIPGENL
ncbi:MAG: hypothetical protein A3B44_00885 [Candidatus Levybacteria bacterium RIFCSPLOWO2_01_FULL_38_21]|nr:MAG: hypothetical protein A3B44_00885 [Candidatus Levybacteria bacterium RIFCSPLOWO2_01_FULL_38_21]